MSTKDFNVSRWVLTLLVIIGSLGALLSYMPEVLSSGSSSFRRNPLLEYGDVLETVGKFLWTVAEVAMFSIVAVKLKKLNITSPSPIIFWIYIATSLLTFVWDGFIVVYFIMMIATAILCFMNSETKKIALWMVGSLIVAIILGIVLEESSFSSKGAFKIILIILCYPQIALLEACKKFILGQAVQVVDTDDDGE